MVHIITKPTLLEWPLYVCSTAISKRGKRGLVYQPCIELTHSRISPFKMGVIRTQGIQHIPMRHASHNSISTDQNTLRSEERQVDLSSSSEAWCISSQSLPCWSGPCTYVLLQFLKGVKGDLSISRASN